MTTLPPDPLAVPPGEWHMYRRDHTAERPLAVARGHRAPCDTLVVSARRFGERMLSHSRRGWTDGPPLRLWRVRRPDRRNRSHNLEKPELRDQCRRRGRGSGRRRQTGNRLLHRLRGDRPRRRIRPASDEALCRASRSPPGRQASTLLCHRFDRKSRGMHLIAPLMSAKEVLVFDFRNGKREGVLAHTLWMDDAFHPTVAAADMDNDGVDELVVSKLCGLYVFNVLTGTMTAIRPLDFERRAPPQLRTPSAHRHRWRRLARGGDRRRTRRTAYRGDRQ